MTITIKSQDGSQTMTVEAGEFIRLYGEFRDKPARTLLYHDDLMEFIGQGNIL